MLELHYPMIQFLINIYRKQQHKKRKKKKVGITNSVELEPGTFDSTRLHLTTPPQRLITKSLGKVFNFIPFPWNFRRQDQLFHQYAIIRTPIIWQNPRDRKIKLEANPLLCLATREGDLSCPPRMSCVGPVRKNERFSFWPYDKSFLLKTEHWIMQF